MQSMPTPLLFGLIVVAVAILSTVICGTLLGGFRRFRGVFWMLIGITTTLILLGVIRIAEVEQALAGAKIWPVLIGFGGITSSYYGFLLLVTREETPPNTIPPPADKEESTFGDPDQGG